MRSTWPRWFALCACLAAWSLTAYGEPPDLSEHLEKKGVRERLENDALVVIKGVDYSDEFGEQGIVGKTGSLVMFIIDVPLETAWGVLTNFAEHHTFMPGIGESEVVSEENGEVVVRYFTEVLWTETTNYMVASPDPGSHTLRWHVDTERSDDRLKALNAFWRLIPQDDGRVLAAFYQCIKHTSRISAMGQQLLVSPRSTAKANRNEMKRVGEALE